MPRRYPPEIRRQVVELAISRKVNEVFLEQGIAPKGSSR